MERTTSWTEAPCPAWCQRAHRHDDHPEDRRHQGPAQHLTLRVGSSPPSADGEVRTIEIVVHADRPAESTEDWLRIESAESPDLRLALTAPATRELVRALGAVLDEISG